MSLASAAPGLAAYLLVVAVLLGLVMGSFLMCLAWRMTHGESVLHGRSHCDTCGHQLAARDLVPVASWLLSRGRCRCCGARISARCPAGELICAALYASIVWRYGLSADLATGSGAVGALAQTLELLCWASTLFVATWTDIDSFIIPNSCVLVGLVTRLIYLLCCPFLLEGAAGFSGFSAWWSSFVSLSLPYLLSALGVGLGLILIALLMDHVLGRESLGGGDVKLLALAALYVGWAQCLLLLLIACVLGIIIGMVQLRQASTAPASSDVDQNGNGEQGLGQAQNQAQDKAQAQTQTPDQKSDPRVFPWGPSIALASWFVLLWGPQIVSAYLAAFL